MWWFPALLVMLVSMQAGAQPADCARLTQAPPGTVETAGPVLPMAIDLARRPGVPRGLSGQVYLGVPIAPNGTLECGPAQPGPRDILHGPASDVLHGPAAGNLLRGPGAPVVRMEPVAR
jgi:hypothetical protein